MNIEELKRLAQAEMALRGSLDQEAVQKWCDTLRELRQAVPDWCVAALELIEENERLEAWRTAFLSERAAQIRQRDQLQAENERLKAALEEALPYTNDVAHDPEVWLRLSSVMVKEARP